MIDAPFSSPDGEPSMEKGDEENALPKSNRNQLPSLSTPNDQTNSEGEETALKALCWHRPRLVEMDVKTAPSRNLREVVPCF